MQPFRNPRHRFTTTEYSQLLQSGAFAPEAHVELIRGEIMDISPRESAHASAVAALHERLVDVVQPHGEIRCGMPLVLDARSQPEPDLLIVNARADHYRNAHPTARDTLWLIEVTDKTLLYDRKIKTSLYAAAHVPVVWIVNTSTAELHCLSDPGKDGYRRRVVLQRHDLVPPPPPFAATVEVGAVF